MSYAEFKTTILAMIDNVLSKYLPVPTEFVDRVRAIPDIETKVDTNSLGEVAELNGLECVAQFLEYNNSIMELSTTRAVVAGRLTFGWFMLTKSNLLYLVDGEINKVREMGTLIFATWERNLSSVSLARGIHNPGEPIPDNLEPSPESDLVELGRNDKITTVKQIIAELKTFIHANVL